MTFLYGSRRWSIALAIGVLLGPAMAGIVREASADGPTVVTFEHTGSAQSWTVPTGVTAIQVEAFGAQGGWGSSGKAEYAGLGGRVKATIAVTPGEVLQVNVGGKGASVTGGFNGGGGAPTGAGGGGGASDVRRGGTTLSDRVVVAGGGGGSGEKNTSITGMGGGGGGTTGGTGQDGNCAGSGGGPDVCLLEQRPCSARSDAALVVR